MNHLTAKFPQVPLGALRSLSDSKGERAADPLPSVYASPRFSLAMPPPRTEQGSAES